MKLYQFIVFALFLTTSCTSPQNSEKVWVYMELAIDNKDITDEYVYGQIDLNTIEALKSKKTVNQLFTVENIRYISLEDSIEVEESSERAGVSTYNLLDVRQVDYLKNDPLFIDEGLPLSKRSLKIRDKLLSQ